MTRPPTESSLRPYLWSIAFLALLVLSRWAVANGADLPQEIVLQGFVKPEVGRLHLLVRVPLVFLQPFALHLNVHGLGSASEIFDGDPPFTPRGCIAQAWSVAEVLRAWINIAAASAASDRVRKDKEGVTLASTADSNRRR